MSISTLTRIDEICSTISETYRGKDKKVILINTSDVLEGKILNFEEVENKNLRGQFKKTFKKNDILFSEIRPANKRFAFVNIDDTHNFIASTKLMVLRPNLKRVLPEFLYYILSSDYLLSEMQHLAETRSGTFPQITFSSELGPFEIELPDINCQRKIVSILKNIDEKIELNNEINDNLCEQIKATYKRIIDGSNNLKVTRIGDLPIYVTDYVANGSFASLKENVTLYQEPNYAYFIRNTDLKSGKDIIVVDEKIRPTPQRIKVHRYDNATIEGAGTWTYECRNCGWESESFAE